MPILRFDIVKGRSDDELKTLLDAAHQAVLNAFDVPPRDRYQIVHEHEPREMVVEDTGLGFERTSDVVIVTVTSRPRSDSAKQRFYEELCRLLQERARIRPTDVVVSFVINADVDWSFGEGRAQFVTGEL